MLLALMPQSPCFPLQTTAPMATGTMSLAILPSAPMTYRPSPANSTSTPSSLSTPGAPSPSKRPKLSLNTANAPTTVFGKGSTSLRLETLSATSPTSRNTFRNAYSQSQPQQRRPTLRSPRSPHSPRLRISQLVTSMDPSSTSSGSPTSASINTPSPNDTMSTPSLSSSSSSASTTSTSATPTATTPDSTSTSLPPYKVAFNIISILTNSPLAPSSPSNSRKRAWSQTKPIFPAMKKVAFRTPLTEDIHTAKYTYRHSDLESPSSSTISTLELSPPEEAPTSIPNDATASAKDLDDEAAPLAGSLASSPRTGDKRESSDEEDDDEDSDDPAAASRSCPATPTAGRRKRHRQWVWTLGPIEPSEAPLTASQESLSS